MSELRIGLKHLIRAALGTDNLTRMNWAIIWGIIDFIIKKLHCEDEIILFDEYLSKCISKLQTQVKYVPVKLKMTREPILYNRIQRIPDLKIYAEFVRSRVLAHIKLVSKHDFTYIDSDVIMNCHNTVSSIKEGVNLHTECTITNDIACNIMGNKDYLRKMTHIILLPIINMFFELEDKVMDLHKDLDSFLKNLHNILHYITMLPLIVDDLDALEYDIHYNDNVFFDSMLEVQDFVDCKGSLLKWNILKSDIFEEIRTFKKRIAVMVEESSCPVPVGALKHNLKCMMCKNEDISINIGVLTPPFLPAFHLTAKTIPRAKFKRKCVQRKYITDAKEIEYIEGENGYIYRSTCKKTVFPFEK